eukprot:4634632-Prymnesium_polylepis.1
MDVKARRGLMLANPGRAPGPWAPLSSRVYSGRISTVVLRCHIVLRLRSPSPTRARACDSFPREARKRQNPSSDFAHPARHARVRHSFPRERDREPDAKTNFLILAPGGGMAHGRGPALGGGGCRNF